jgi:hypothetical protein
MGGIARRPEIGSDGLTLIACHEVGHHISGWPFYFEPSWAAAEGQSDYFSTLACARKIWGGEEEINAQFRQLASPQIRAICDQAWQSEPEQNLCYRSLSASLELARLLANTEGSSVGIDARDPTVSDSTKRFHPKAQCRLDTLVSGALCRASFDDSAIPRGSSSSAQKTCMGDNWPVLSQRPRCWFKPD